MMITVTRSSSAGPRRARASSIAIIAARAATLSPSRPRRVIWSRNASAADICRAVPSSRTTTLAKDTLANRAKKGSILSSTASLPKARPTSPARRPKAGWRFATAMTTAASRVARWSARAAAAACRCRARAGRCHRRLRDRPPIAFADGLRKTGALGRGRACDEDRSVLPSSVLRRSYSKQITGTS